MPPEVTIDATLHLPRLLCLHSGGTNSRIFRLQCRVLSRRLSSTFCLCYAEALFPSKPGPDVVSVYKDYGPFKAWLCWGGKEFDSDLDREGVGKSAAQCIRDSLFSAMDEDDAQGATGEWVGLLGFSQGAKICASLLYMQQVYQDGFGRGVRKWPNFRFGVLVAGRGLLVSLVPGMRVPDGLVRAEAPMEEVPDGFVREVVRAPTIHVHGLEDPGIQAHRRLLQEYFDEGRAVLQEWDGEHRILIKTNDVVPLVEGMVAMAEMTGAVSMFQSECR